MRLLLLDNHRVWEFAYSGFFGWFFLLFIFFVWSKSRIRAVPYSTTWCGAIDRLCTEAPTTRSHNLSSTSQRTSKFYSQVWGVPPALKIQFRCSTAYQETPGYACNPAA
ncbi:MAG: hypothetical protein WCD53_28120 [Microcoleus sp.]